MNKPPILSPEIVRLNTLIRAYGEQVAKTGDSLMSPELVAAIATLTPYIPPKCPHDGEYPAHHRQGFNRCRAEVMNGGPIE